MGDLLARVDAGLERGEDVLPADDDHRVDAVGEQRRDAVAADPIALVLQAVDLDEVGRQLGARCAGERSARATCSPAPTSTSPICDACSIGASTRKSPMLSAACSAKSTMSSSVGGQLVAVDGIHRRPAGVAALEAVDDVVGDAVALVLAEHELARQVGALGIVDEQIAQQQRGALDVVAALLEERQDLGVGLDRCSNAIPPTLAAARRRGQRSSPFVHSRFTAG